MKDLKKSLSKKWYKSKAFMIGASIASVGVVTTIVVVPVAFSLNQNGSSVNGPLKGSKPQLKETEIKLNKLNSELTLDEKSLILNSYLNHQDTNGKTPTDIFVEKLDVNRENVINFVLSTYPNIFSKIPFMQLEIIKNAKDFLIGKSNMLLIKNFPDSSVQGRVIAQSVNLDMGLVLQIHLFFSTLSDIRFCHNKIDNTFYVELYNIENASSIFNLNIFQNVDSNLFIDIYDSGFDDEKINFLNYGFENFTNWFIEKVLNLLPSIK